MRKKRERAQPLRNGKSYQCWADQSRSNSIWGAAWGNSWHGVRILRKRRHTTSKNSQEKSWSQSKTHLLRWKMTYQIYGELDLHCWVCWWLPWQWHEISALGHPSKSRVGRQFSFPPRRVSVTGIQWDCTGII